MANDHRGVYVVMGVAGAGKSTIGAALARALGASFIDGDALHPQANKDRMAAGIPLTDDDRREWLRLIADRLRAAETAGTPLVVACSALKVAYRQVLRDGAPAVRFIYLRGERALLNERLAGRQGHFMPPSLLESQLQTLEPPSPDEGAWQVDIGENPAVIVADLVSRIIAVESTEHSSPQDSRVS